MFDLLGKGTSLMVTKTMDQIRTAVATLNSIQHAAEAALRNGSGVVILVTVRDSAPQGDKVLLCKGQGPRGELLSCQVSDESNKWKIVARYPAAGVVAFSKRMIRELMK
jgi:hypothetical protein